MKVETAIKILSGETLGTTAQLQMAVEMAIKAMTAQRWIPVTERLPKESDGKVLITVSGEVDTGKYSEFSNRWYIGDMNAVGGDAPIAWMPLPECYKG